jgi:drug/metabolite transporter (DMT)-like permease
MNGWLRRIRGAVGMGLTWAIGWTVAGMAGAMAVYMLFPGLPDVFDVWIPVFAYPGFLAGVGFSLVLRVAEGRHTFEELSLPRFAAWGALGGLLLGAFLTAMAFGEVPTAALAAITGTTTLLSAASAAGSLALARTSDDRALLGTGEEG